MQESDLIVLFGCVALLGSLTVMVTDWVGWTRKREMGDSRLDLSDLDAPMKDFYRSGAAGISERRLLTAGVVGSMAMWPTAAGAIPLYFVLRPAGPGLAALCAFTFAGGYILAAFAHPMLAYVTEITRTYSARAKGSAERNALRHPAMRAVHYLVPNGIGSIFVCILVSSMLFSAIVFTSETHLPTWAGFLNIFLIAEITRQIGRRAPYAVERWILPANIHLFATAPFLAVVTWYCWTADILVG